MSSVARMILLSASVIAAGGCTDRGKSEARLVIDRIEAIEPYAALDERRRLVSQLEQLEVETSDVRKVRDACVEAHRTLIEAEELQAEAKEALDQVEGAKAEGDQKLADSRAVGIAKTIERSNDALLEAGDQLPDCQEQAAELASRYELRH